MILKREDEEPVGAGHRRETVSRHKTAISGYTVLSNSGETC